MLKLKASIGQSGNDEIEEDGVSCICLRLSELTERIGVLPILYRRYCCRGVCNEDVSWEVSTKTNVGFELSLFNALRLQADYFYERRKGIFVQRQSLPDYVGVSTMPWSNVGKMQNQGIDATLEFDKSFGEFFLSARGTFTYARNKQIDNDQPDYIDKYRNRNGQKYGQQSVS